MIVAANGIAKAIADYTHAGLSVIRLHGIDDNGSCTCGKGDTCSSPGKHTVGHTWQITNDEEQVFEWWGDNPKHNVGLLLGPTGGVIDIEADDDAAEAELKRRGLERFGTPTWSSGRGLHRLFRWNDRLPAQAVVKPAGVEIRIGGGGKLAQSVLPPSRHHSGRLYQWQNGFGLGEVEIAEVPDSIMELIAESRPAQQATGSHRQAAAIIRRPQASGGRNDSLFRCACLLARSVPPDNDDAEAALLSIIRSINTTQCQPPLPDDEVVGIFRSALKYRRESVAGERIFPGVSVVAEGRRLMYRPDGLEATIYVGDPTRYVLACDEFRMFNSDGRVSVAAEVWGDDRKMKLALLEAFPGMPVDRHPGDFAAIWNGLPPLAATRSRDGRDGVTGLRVILETEAVEAGRRHEITDPAEHAGRMLVGFFVEQIDRCDGNEPWELREALKRDSNVVIDRAKLVHYVGDSGGNVGAWAGGDIIFVWSRMWHRIVQKYLPARGDERKLLHAIRSVIGHDLKPQRSQHGGKKYSFRSLTRHEVARLRDYASGDTATAAT